MTLFEHLEAMETEYVYGVGVSNLNETGIDPALIGILGRHKEIDTVFKCIKPDFMDCDYPRIVFRDEKSKKKNWTVMDTNNLFQIS